MDRDRALDQLGGTYARALRLAGDGCSHAEIAADLDMDEAAVPSLLQIGNAKLARLLTEPEPERDDGAEGTDDARFQ